MPGELSQETGSTLPAAPVDRLPSGPARVTGARKAAVLMAALGSERAANVIQKLREDEIESLSMEMAKLTAVGAETTQSVLGEVALSGGGGSGASGGLEFAREVIERALGPERAGELLGRLSGSTETRPFEFLRRVPPERIVALLKSEPPQTAALILASLPTSLAAAVLSRMPEQLQPDVALRIARMGHTSANVIEAIEDTLRQKLGAVSEREYASAGGTKALAGILNHADRALERNVLENLASKDKGVAEEVRGMLFVFEDIVKLDERAIQQVLREVDQKDLVIALRTAEEELMELVLSNMSERGAAMLKEEMEIQPKQRKRDIDEAQSRIVAVIRKLEEAGTIVIGGEEDEQGEEAEADD